MKARFKYRIYPTLGQKHRLARLVGCVRVVWNDSLACCQEKYKLGKKKPTNSELQKQFITLAKKTEGIVRLSEAFCPCHYSDLETISTRLIKTFLNQLKATEKVNL